MKYLNEFQRTIDNTNMRQLYHYQSFDLSDLDKERLSRILNDGEIYCSNPVDFNDPWDMKPLTRNLIIDGGINDFREYILNHLNNGGYSSQLIEKLTSNDVELQKIYDGQIESHWYSFQKYFRAYCLTPKNDNLLMWSHYANKHKGICLEFKTDNEVFGSAWKVEYFNLYPFYNWKDNADPMRFALIKSDCWRYEEEYRLLPKTPMVSDYIHQPYLMVDEYNQLIYPKDALLSVIIGCQADYKKVKRVVHEIRPDIKIKRAVLLKDRYGLDIIEQD